MNESTKMVHLHFLRSQLNFSVEKQVTRNKCLLRQLYMAPNFSELEISLINKFCPIADL